MRKLVALLSLVIVGAGLSVLDVSAREAFEVSGTFSTTGSQVNTAGASTGGDMGTYKGWATGASPTSKTFTCSQTLSPVSSSASCSAPYTKECVGAPVSTTGKIEVTEDVAGTVAKDEAPLQRPCATVPE